MKQKSDIRAILSEDELFSLLNDFKEFIKYLLLESKKDTNHYKDILFAYSLARVICQVDTIFFLWSNEYYSDCWILYRVQVEKLLTLHYLIDTDTVEKFDDWSFIKNFEARNNAKSDSKNKKYLIKKFWTENPERIERYQNLKSKQIEWKRPTSSQFEEIAEQHNVLELYKFGYKFASHFVHPMSFDGEHEYSIVTGITPKGEVNEDTTPFLFNSLIVLIYTVRLLLDETSFSWNEYIYKFPNQCYQYMESKDVSYQETLKLIRFMIKTKFPIYKKDNT
ncbi:MAG: DUF5677 domain-containing protein [Bacteroidales bacterium]|jgi:hypothetical protein